MQPLDCSKEVYPLDGKPLMDHLVIRLRAAGCNEIRVVTRPDKRDVIEHARASGLTVVEAGPASVSESLLAGLDGVDEDRIVLFGFPDTIWEPIDGFTLLLRALDDCDLALGLFWGREPERSDVVTVAPDGVVVSIEVKPHAPTSHWIWGCAAARRRVLNRLSSHPEPGVVFDEMCREGKVVGVYLSRFFVDVGTPEALRAYVEAPRADGDSFI